jgi:hypothetical protein
MEPFQANHEAPKLVAAVRRINERWIVRGRLKDHANEYLAHLERHDAERLVKSCQLALELVRNRMPGEDPKPLFYAGLFGFATEPEVDVHLAEHLFTRAICRLLHGQAERPVYLALPDSVRVQADLISVKIQATIDRLFEKRPASPA